MAGLTWKDGTARLYDSTATPFYFEIVFLEDGISGPAGRPRPEEFLMLDRGEFTANSAYRMGDDSPITEPLDITIRAALTTTTPTYLYQALICGTINEDAWATTKGDSTLTNGAGSSITCPAFADSSKKCVNLEVLWECGATDMGLQWMEIYFDPGSITFSEGAEGLIVEAAGKIYGDINWITSLTSGTSSPST